MRNKITSVPAGRINGAIISARAVSLNREGSKNNKDGRLRWRQQLGCEKSLGHYVGEVGWMDGLGGWLNPLLLAILDRCDLNSLRSEFAAKPIGNQNSVDKAERVKLLRTEMGAANSSRDPKYTFIDSGTAGKPCKLNLPIKNAVICDLRFGALRWVGGGGLVRGLGVGYGGYEVGWLQVAVGERRSDMGAPFLHTRTVQLCFSCT